MNSLLKSVYYLLKPQRLHPGMRLKMGYIFHTEAIHDSTYWPLLKKFCMEYRSVTGVQPICAVMTPVNARIAKQMKACGCSEQEYVVRVRELETMAVIGHHGHYYKDPAHYAIPEGEVKKENYDDTCLTEQFHNDRKWFRENSINHNGLYASGWWFMHRNLVDLLIAERYRVDFSFTQSPVFGHQWSKGVMRKGSICFGEPFRLKSEKGTITLIQNLIGCHNTPFVADFTRHINALFNPERPTVVGVVNTHDFNLGTNYDFTFKVLRDVVGLQNVSFWGRSEIERIVRSDELTTIKVGATGDT